MTDEQHMSPAQSNAPRAVEQFVDMTFEQIVEELEATARAMDSQDLGIESAAELYGRAAALHAAATERLAAVQRRVDQLKLESEER